MADTSHRTDLTGRVLMNKLRVVRMLGEGGMGAVYEVEHLITRHRRALKVMHSTYASSPETIARFVREAGVAGTLKTPHVVETYDAGQLDDGSPYVLMEMLEGQTLGELYASGEKVPVGRVVGLICQVLEGLDVAHRAGIVHRDIKPDNVFVGTGIRDMPRVTLLDFGISKFLDTQFDMKGSLTVEGAMMGTPYYMSLEQASGRVDIDPRSDLYSVGVMLYEGLVGKRPYEANSLTALVVMIHEGDYEPMHKAAPHLPMTLAAVVKKAMAVKREDRYQTASELLAALMPFADSRYVVSLHTLRLSKPLDATMAAPAAPTVVAPTRVSAAPAPPSRPLWPLAVGLGVLIAAGLSAYALTRPAPLPQVPSAPVQAQATPVVPTPEVTPAVVPTPEVAPEVVPTPEVAPEATHATAASLATERAHPRTRPVPPREESPVTTTPAATVATTPVTAPVTTRVEPPAPVETPPARRDPPRESGRLELDRNAF